MRRTVLGLAAIALLVSGFAMHLTLSDANWQMFGAACIRVGLVLLAVWLAYAQLERMAKTVSPLGLAVALLCLIICVASPKPKLIVYFLPVLALLAILHVAGWFTKPSPPGKNKKSASK
jgi:hypothetical protein